MAHLFFEKLENRKNTQSLFGYINPLSLSQSYISPTSLGGLLYGIQFPTSPINNDPSPYIETLYGIPSPSVVAYYGAPYPTTNYAYGIQYPENLYPINPSILDPNSIGIPSYPISANPILWNRNPWNPISPNFNLWNQMPWNSMAMNSNLWGYRTPWSPISLNPILSNSLSWGYPRQWSPISLNSSQLGPFNISPMPWNPSPWQIDSTPALYYGVGIPREGLLGTLF